MCTGKNTKWKLRVQLTDRAQKRWRRRRGCFLCYMAVVVTWWVGSHVLQQGGKKSALQHTLRWAAHSKPTDVRSRRGNSVRAARPTSGCIVTFVTRGRQRSHTHTRGSALASTRTHVPHPSYHSLSTTFKLSGLHAVQTFVHIIQCAFIL